MFKVDDSALRNDPTYKKALEEYYSYEYSPSAWWTRRLLPWLMAVPLVLMVLGVVAVILR